MTESLSDNKRIAKNTIVLYARMVVMLILSFYTSRIVLEALGVVNLGIYSVVGGVLSLLGLINSSMTLSVQRFLAFDIGKRDNQALNTTFSTAVIIHIALAVIIVVLAETVGLYFLTHYINYPPERHDAVLWVYHLSVLGSFISIIQIPYGAIIVAYERMHIYAWFTILDVLIRLLLISLLLIITCDTLIFFAVFGSVVGIVMFIINRVYFHYQFRNVRFRLVFDKRVIKNMVSFAGWSTYGEFAWAGTNQGTDILLNLYFGPATNGVRSMAYQVQSIVMRFVMSFQGAINPQVIKRYAAGEHENMRNLVYRGTCFSVYLTLLLALPFLLEADFLLNIWLISVPEELALFAKIIIVNIFIDMLTNLHAAAAKAYGNISRYQMVVSLFLSLNFILSFVALHFGMPAYSVFLVYSFVAAMLCVVRLFLLRQMIPMMTISSFLGQVIRPVFKVAAIALIAPIATEYALDDSWVSSLIICSVSVFSVALSVWLIGLSRNERRTLIGYLISAAPFLKRFIRPITGIVTWITYHNYGSFLQAYALQQILKRLGYKNRIIRDRVPASQPVPVSIRGRLRAWKARFKQTMNRSFGSDQMYRRFAQKYLSIDTESDAGILNLKYSTIVCGSDQIWSPYLKFEPFYYLDFYQGRKIAYAPSVGTRTWNQEYLDNIGPLIRQFHALSVRELESAEALGKALNLKIKTVLDPTLLLSGAEWKEMLLRKDKRPGGYIICYFLTPNAWYLDYVKDYAVRQNKSVRIFDNQPEYRDWAESVQAGPQEFLSYINAADEVFTDSFHATIFSILFHKKFTTFKRFEDGGEKDQNLRLYNLFALIGLHDYFIGRDDLALVDQLPMPDYESIDSRLADLRSASISYLKNALSQ